MFSTVAGSIGLLKVMAIPPATLWTPMIEGGMAFALLARYDRRAASLYLANRGRHGKLDRHQPGVRRSGIDGNSHGLGRLAGRESDGLIDRGELLIPRRPVRMSPRNRL